MEEECSLFFIKGTFEFTLEGPLLFLSVIA